MSIAEKLTTIAQNEQKVYDAGYILGLADGKQSAYETIVIAQDSTSVQSAYNVFAASISGGENVVLFINKAWTGVPDASTTNNRGLWLMWLSNEYKHSSAPAFWGRWRNSAYTPGTYINNDYDFIVSSGDEWIKVVLA